MAGRPWTSDEVFYLEGHYGRVSIAHLATRLNRTPASVQRKAQVMGLTKTREVDNLPWTEEELRILERNYEKKGAVQLAKRLKRTPCSVQHKAQKMCLNSYVNDYLSMKTLAQCFDSDPSVIHRWHEQYELPMKAVKRGQVTMYRIDPEKFWEWAEKHIDQIPFHKYNPYSILPQPEWVATAMHAQKNKRNRTPITRSERQYVISRRQNGATFAQIAEETQRSIDAIKHIWRKR